MVRALDRRAAAVGRTRSCPHCRATILESATVCPACRHHLRFENRRGQQPEAASQVALKVSGEFARREADGPGEYSVVVVIRDASGAELARKVIGVGGLAAGEERRVDLTVEMFDPSGS
jgi:hypothetical protein